MEFNADFGRVAAAELDARTRLNPAPSGFALTHFFSNSIINRLKPACVFMVSVKYRWVGFSKSNIIGTKPSSRRRSRSALAGQKQKGKEKVGFWGLSLFDLHSDSLR